jgi:hypothetical protein
MVVLSILRIFVISVSAFAVVLFPIIILPSVVVKLLGLLLLSPVLLCANAFYTDWLLLLPLIMTKLATSIDEMTISDMSGLNIEVEVKCTNL